MPDPNDAVSEKGTCFVVMGFGKKTDFETGRVLDLDKSYHNLIKPAVLAAGLKCIRADEIVHSGEIDKPMYDLLFNADVVVADLSTSNRNAIYELGVRHALRPYTTVIIAEEQMTTSKFFDLSHIVIRQYKHLGEDIGVSEAQRFTAALTAALKEIIAKNPNPCDSPVYGSIAGLTPPSLAKQLQRAVEAAVATGTAHSDLIHQVDECQEKGDWRGAKTLLEAIRTLRKAKGSGADDKVEDPYILQRLALATYKSKDPTPEGALKAARDVLQLLDPQVSNDTETLGLWGSVHKRLWDLTKDKSYLDQAIRGYERGFYLRNDYYNGINYAYLSNERAASTASLAEAVADFIQARRVREEVLDICQQWLAANPAAAKSDSSPKLAETRYWVLATMAEAQIGLEDGLGQQRLDQALAAAPQDWMKQSTEDQVNKLKALLASSPLTKLPATR